MDRTTNDRRLQVNSRSLTRSSTLSVWEMQTCLFVQVECSECFRVIVMAMVQRVLNAGCMPGAADDAGARAGWPAGWGLTWPTSPVHMPEERSSRYRTWSWRCQLTPRWSRFDLRNVTAWSDGTPSRLSLAAPGNGTFVYNGGRALDCVPACPDCCYNSSVNLWSTLCDS